MKIWLFYICNFVSKEYVIAGYIEKQGKEQQIFFLISHSFIFRMRKSRAEKTGNIQIHKIILNFSALDFRVWKIN